MGQDYVPRSDANFAIWIDQYHRYVQAHAQALEVKKADIDALADRVGRFQQALQEHLAVQQQACAATEQKNRIRLECQNAIRSLSRQLQVRPATTDVQRLGLGLTPRQNPVRSPLSIPEPQRTQPILTVDRSQSCRHLLAVRDTAEISQRRRPQNVIGWELWRKRPGAGSAGGAGDEEYLLIDIPRRLSYTLEYDGAMAGKTVSYRIRWVYRDSTRGPWSDALSAMVLG